MSFFQEIKGEAAVLVENGIYRQVPLFSRDGYLYAKINGGFVRLMADGSTTKARLRLDFMSFDRHLCRDSLGRLCTDEVKDAKSLDSDKVKQLLGNATGD